MQKNFQLVRVIKGILKCFNKYIFFLKRNSIYLIETEHLLNER